MEFNYQFDEFSESFFAGRDYCLLGNGFLRLVVQLKNNFGSSGNAILLNLISSDEYRARRFLLLAHHAFKEMPSCVSVRHEGRFFCADSRQIGTDSLHYELLFEDGVPTLKIAWEALYELSRDETPRITDEQIEDVALAPGNIGLASGGPSTERPRVPLRVEERLWCPAGVPAVVREVTVTNAGKRGVTGLAAWHFLAPNKLFLPDARYLAGPDIAASGYWGGARQFLGLAALDGRTRHVVAEYPGAIDLAADGRDARGPSGGRDARGRSTRRSAQRLENPFMGPHLGAGVSLPTLAPGKSAVARFAIVYGKTEKEMTRAGRGLRGSLSAARRRTTAGSDGQTSIVTGDERLDRLYCMAKAGIRASVSGHEKPGRINAGILQYDAEWSRDHDFIAAAAAMNGQHDIARDILRYALANLMDDKGHCFCGAAWQGGDRDYQIDTNGIRLWAVWLYTAFTGDERVARDHWPRVRALVDVFFDPIRWVPEARMLASTRDCWERWRNCGLLPGFELEHQLWASIGLAKAGELAAVVGETSLAGRCRKRSEQVWQAVLSHPRFALVHGGRFMKRRTLDGAIQKTANAYRGARTGYLEPDSSELQPIISGLVDPDSACARATLRAMEALWNQGGLWKGGGYTRYNITSDPEPASGPWPGVTLMVARAALAARQWDTWKRAMDWIYRSAAPTWTLFEHYDFAAADKKNRRWYRGGIIPWLSFAEPSMLMVQDMLGFRADLEGFSLQPILPPGIRSVDARVPWRGKRVSIHVRGSGRTCRSVMVDGTPSGAFDSRGTRFLAAEAPAKVEMVFG